MKNQPFKEIINLKLEYKDYRKLCQNKHKTYKYYDDWMEHILKLFEKLENKNINNFKHFLCFYSFCENHSIKILLPTLTAFVPIMVNAVYSDNPILNIIATALSIIFASFLISLNYFKCVHYAKFFDDILEVLEIYIKKLDLNTVEII